MKGTSRFLLWDKHVYLMCYLGGISLDGLIGMCLLATDLRDDHHSMGLGRMYPSGWGGAAESPHRYTS